MSRCRRPTTKMTLIMASFWGPEYPERTVRIGPVFGIGFRWCLCDGMGRCSASIAWLSPLQARLARYVRHPPRLQPGSSLSSQCNRTGLLDRNDPALLTGAVAGRVSRNRVPQGLWLSCPCGGSSPAAVIAVAAIGIEVPVDHRGRRCWRNMESWADDLRRCDPVLQASRDTR